MPFPLLGLHILWYLLLYLWWVVVMVVGVVVKLNFGKSTIRVSVNSPMDTIWNNKYQNTKNDDAIHLQSAC